jgi:hypothetical protein
MSLTGVPLILLAVLVTAGVSAATVLLWSRFGRWRLLSRSAGILLTEALVLLSAGLVANRAEQFYPSWQALAGDTGTAVTTARPITGRLDEQFRGRAAAVPWRPAGAAGWRLAGTPTLVVPAGYGDGRMLTYPVVLSLVDGSDRAAVSAALDTAGAVSVVASPTARTTTLSLASLPAALPRDVRVTAGGWAVVATMRQAPFAARLIRAEPELFVALAVVADPASPALPAAARPGGQVAVAVLRTADAASAWAQGQTSPPLAAPRQLPARPVAAGR